MTMFQYIGWQRIMDGQGFDIVFTGMFVVFLALTAISLFIAVLPKAMAVLAWHRPPKVLQPSSVQESKDDDAAVVAAVGFVLNERENSR